MKKNIFILFLVIASLLLFCLPYLFNDMEVSQSVSYMVGFNNKVAFILLLLLCLVPFIIGIKQKEVIPVWNFEGQFKLNNTVVTICLISFVLIIGTGILFNDKDFYGFVEDGYFLHYVKAVGHGASLYRDIQFIYGPLCVYPIVWLSSTGISITYSYYLVLGVYHIIGLSLIYYILLKLRLSERERKYVFIIIAILLFPYTMGLNNGTLRYALAPFFIVQTLSNYDNRSVWHNLVIVVMASVVTLGYSPEIGLCFIFAVCIWLVVALFFNRRLVSVIHMTGALTILGMTFYYYPEYLSSIIQAGSGGSNFPFVPSLILILFFLAIFAVSFLFGRQSTDIKNNNVYLGIEILLLSMIVAAIGRCDPSHIISFALFLFVISFIVLKRSFPKKIVIIVYLLCLSTYFPYQIMVLKLYVTQAARSNIGFVDKYVSSNLPFSDLANQRLEDYKKRESSSIISFDFGSNSVTSIGLDNLLYNYLLDNTNYKHTFFEHTPQWIGTRRGFIKEIESLNTVNANFLVLHSNYRERWLSSNDYSIINLLFCTYYPVSPIRTYNEQLYGDLIEFIDKYYSVISIEGSYIVLERSK